MMEESPTPSAVAGEQQQQQVPLTGAAAPDASGDPVVIAVHV